MILKEIQIFNHFKVKLQVQQNQLHFRERYKDKRSIKRNFFHMQRPLTPFKLNESSPLVVPNTIPIIHPILMLF